MNREDLLQIQEWAKWGESPTPKKTLEMIRYIMYLESLLDSTDIIERKFS